MRKLGMTMDIPCWEKRPARSFTIVYNNEPQNVLLKIAYSCQGPPFLELIERVPASPWSIAGGIHHLGYAVDDVRAVGRELQSAGLDTIAYIKNDHEHDNLSWRTAYFKNQMGVTIEL